VLFDRDGTLVVDVPYNADPNAVALRPFAREVVAETERLGLRRALISNQSGIGRGLLEAVQVEAVTLRMESLLGASMRPWLVCPHAPSAGCRCRKPAPGLVLAAAAYLGVAPGTCLVVGDIGADVEAARRAGAMAVLVPTEVTRPEEVRAAPLIARDLGEVIQILRRTAARAG